MVDWSIWLILAGRGYGKTYKGSKQIVEYMDSYTNLHIGLIGNSKEEVKHIMVEGMSGILPRLTAPYRLTKSSLNYKTTKCFFFNGNNYEQLRGFQFDIVWIDELCKIRPIKQLLNQVWLCLRLGISKLIITTTPKNVNELHSLMERPDIKIEYGSSKDNPKLSKGFFENIKYLEEPYQSQEVEGKIVSNLCLSNIKIIPQLPEGGLLVLGIDPAVVDGLTGIILVSHHESTKIVIEDWSTYSPYDIWIDKLKTKLSHIDCLIHIEVNQGGHLWKKLLAPLKKRVYMHFSHESKPTRQYFLQQMYKQKTIQHIKPFPKLNAELIGTSADRVDALFFAVNYRVKLARVFLAD